MSLTLVPTPLGNLRDITLRALDVLRACDLVVAEDTRVARRLLSALEIPGKPVWSYREQSGAAGVAAVIERARTEAVVFTSDAGTPGISDPGRDLVVAARAAGVPVDVLPGACAFVCAVVLAGFPLDHVAFDGFVPRAKNDRERALRAALARDGVTTAFYESPNRIAATLDDLARIAPDARCFVARELTKLHEEHLLGTAGEIRARLSDPVRGEIVLVVPSTPKSAADGVAPEAIDARIDAGLDASARPADLARELSDAGFGARNALYARIVNRIAERRGSRNT